MHLLDTDHCVFWLRGEQRIRQKIDAVGWSNIAISVITGVELFYGAHNSGLVADELTKTRLFINRCHLCPINLPIMDVFGKLQAEAKRKGGKLPDFDLLIASTALVLEVPLATNNLRHFEKIAGLQIENWMQDP